MDQKVFDWFSGNFNLSLLESEWHDIQSFVNEELQSQLTQYQERVKELETLAIDCKEVLEAVEKLHPKSKIAKLYIAKIKETLTTPLGEEDKKETPFVIKHCKHNLMKHLCSECKGGEG